MRVASVQIRPFTSRIRCPGANRRVEGRRMNTRCAVLRGRREGLGGGSLRTKFLRGTHGGMVVDGDRVFLTRRVDVYLWFRDRVLEKFTGNVTGFAVMNELPEGTGEETVSHRRGYAKSSGPDEGRDEVELARRGFAALPSGEIAQFEPGDFLIQRSDQ